MVANGNLLGFASVTVTAHFNKVSSEIDKELIVGFVHTNNGEDGIMAGIGATFKDFLFFNLCSNSNVTYDCSDFRLS